MQDTLEIEFFMPIMSFIFMKLFHGYRITDGYSIVEQVHEIYIPVKREFSLLAIR